MREFSRVEIILVATSFALASLAIWYLWLEPVWKALSLPRLHHWIYGAVCVGVGIELNSRTRRKRVSYFLVVVGAIWFLDDLQDFGVFF